VSGASAVRERADRDAVETEVAGAAPAAPTTPARGWAGICDVAVILGLCLIAWLLTNDFAQPGLMLAYGIEPAVVPRAVILVIAGLALLLLVQELGHRHGRLRIRLHPRVPAMLFAFAALTAYSLSFEPLGAFTLMPLFCVAVSRAFVERPLWKLLLYGIGVTVATWVFFVLLLRTPLPGSSLPFL
jgi:Tripartite tricarboxylate transporter TctB family